MYLIKTGACGTIGEYECLRFTYIKEKIIKFLTMILWWNHLKIIYKFTYSSATQGQFIADLIGFNSLFFLLDWFPYQSRIVLSKLLFTYFWREYIWVHTFPKCISDFVKCKKKSQVHDLNLFHRDPFFTTVNITPRSPLNIVGPSYLN